MIYHIHIKSEKDTIQVNEQEVLAIQSAQEQKISGVWIGSKYIALTSIRMIVPGEQAIYTPLLNGGLDMSTPGLPPEERKRKMKLLALSYWDGRNEIRETRKQPAVQLNELPRNIQAYLADEEPADVPPPVNHTGKQPHVPGWSSVGEILAKA